MAGHYEAGIPKRTAVALRWIAFNNRHAKSAVLEIMGCTQPDHSGAKIITCLLKSDALLHSPGPAKPLQKGSASSSTSTVSPVMKA